MRCNPRGGCAAPCRAQRTASAACAFGAPSDAPVVRGLSLTLGWRRLREEEGRSDDLGFAVAWERRF